ncbi:transient receptor potential cation channel subfamily M member 2-like isoform X2 [Ostrea edulis]|uniref:transient receptor potential cation channel subfamily M member 2-like isoform X2 n=1 Tax=Ostrea edulis TaxID=37623 RepID=UPI0024AF8001|nr:transient receptor potential cation channel subfamily M member 2-like isoform X2 [Ostrea edulis]
MSDVQSSWDNIKENVNSTPTMVFSVIGDSDSFVPRPWAKTVFQTALIEAAKSGGESWILYRGHNNGVSDIVRDAYRNYGYMEFSVDANGKKRTKESAKDKKKKRENIKNVERHVKLIRIAEDQTIYDESLPEYREAVGAEDDFLLKFEKFVSEQEVSFFSQKMDFRMPVPIAIIVCEGDIETIAHISGALEMKLPVIIIKGSGKAADLILDYMENPEKLRKKASLLFGIRFDDNSFETLTKYLETIKKKEDLIGVFDVDNDDPLMLSNIVGEAVVSCWAMEKILTEEIKNLQTFSNENRPKSAFPHSKTNGLAMTGSSVAWKLLKRNSVRPEETMMNQLLEDYKKESRAYVLNPKYASPTSLPLYFYFGYQLLQESKLLMDSGHTVSCKDCKFKEDDCLHMQWILKQIEETHAKNLCYKYRSVVRKLKDAKAKEDKKSTKLKKADEEKKDELEEKLEKAEEKVKKYTKKKDKLNDSVSGAAKSLCRKILRYKGTKDKSKDKQTDRQTIKHKNSRRKNDNETVDANTVVVSNESNQEGDISDLLLWAIFANRRELAEICWLRSEDHLLTGLVCSALLQKLAIKANNVKEQILSSELEEHSKLFEQRCIAIMDRMYEENTDHAIDLMDDDVVIWGITSSPLTFAYENFMYDVVAHTCSQKNMNKQWYNNLAPDLVPFLKSAFRKPKKFFTAPLTKYIYNYMMFFSMLVMYSAFVLTSISTEYYVQDIARVFEYYVYFWGAGDFIEELISCFGCLDAKGRSHRGYYSRMKRYLYDFWNVVDLLSYALLITALFVRHMHPSETFTIARRMFSLSLLVMYLRFLEVFLIHRRLGPTLIMIKEMLKDLFGFLFVAVFIVIGVGIYYHANLWPDYQGMWDGDWTKWRIWQIIYYPYFQLYGELFNDFLEGKDLSDCSHNTSVWQFDSSIERCPQEDWTVLGVSAIYMLFSNLLLVNLVIAMFSYTFERVQENSEKLWRFERYTVINDYEWRIPSPINLLFLPYRFFCCPGREGCCLDKCEKRYYPKQVRIENKEKEEAQKFRKNFQRITAFRMSDKL